MTEKLPTREEINVYDSLDERSACKIFLGKTLAEAETLFCESFLKYQEDLMWMGPSAFRFYVPAAICYLQNKAAKGDSDAVNCFIGLLGFRFEYEPEELRPIAKELIGACRYIIDHYDHFDVTLEIYGDLRPRYKQLIQQLTSP